MTVVLPTLPLGSQTNISIQSNAIDLLATFGGPSQRTSRLGDRWTIEVTCRPMRYAQAAGFIAKLIQGLAERVLVAIPQPGLEIGNPGTPLLKGAGQSGRTLQADGFTPGYVIQAGQYFSLVQGGQRYLHQVTDAATANGSGEVELSIYPMLKVSPSDNATLEFAAPKLEGFLQGNRQAWTIGLVENVGLSFAVTEAA
ncbi:hypothetical protein Q0812_10365 [Brevundimonas sp. 2R-24]|uniref:Uncharacterized protein n=1 Tax=Peiella sedimenti TaxID=3061083 RepID=A0ABT8SMN3_9CAUL|nr:hypothetical protein [Caulobacteraceae bacterium XZ-24]